MTLVNFTLLGTQHPVQVPSGPASLCLRSVYGGASTLHFRPPGGASPLHFRPPGGASPLHFTGEAIDQQLIHT
jgi:hypothetical protein